LRDFEKRNKVEQNTKIHLRLRVFAEVEMGLEVSGPKWGNSRHSLPQISLKVDYT
jgi:hypothetical protein